MSRRSRTTAMLRLCGGGNEEKGEKEEKKDDKRDFADPSYQADFPVHWAAIKGDAKEVQKLIEDVVREIEAEISRLQLEDAFDHFAFCSTALRSQRQRTVTNAASLAGSLVAVFSALRNYIVLTAASFYATQGANVASQLTGTLRSLPGERLAPIVGRAFGRFIIGREYAPWTRGKGTGKGKGLGYNFVRR